MKRWPIVLLSVTAAIAVLIFWAVRWWYIKPIISVNHARLLNDMRKPANYDPNKDGWLVMEHAIKVLENAEHIRVLGPGDTPIRDPFRTFLHLSAQWPGDVNASELAQLREWMTKNGDALDLVKKAEAMSQFWPKTEEQDGPMWEVIWRPVDGLANGFSGLLWRGKMAASEGRIEQGLDDILAAGEMGRCFGSKPIPVERLVSAAYTSACCDAVAEVLARARLSDGQLASLARRVEAMGAETIYVPDESDDFYIRDIVQRFFSDNGHGDGRLLTRVVYEDAVNRQTQVKYPWQEERLPPGFAMIQAVRFAWRTEGRKATLARLAEMQRIRNELHQTLPYRPDYMRLREEYERCRQANPFIQIYSMDGGEEIRSAAVWHRRANRAQGLLTTIAILRYKVDKGKPPKTLGALVEEGYLKELAVDRFTGEPFIYRAAADDFTLYSAGDNAKDDGGTRKGRLDKVYWPVEVHPGK